MADIYGTSGNDVLAGRNDADDIAGFAGNDSLFCLGGADDLYGSDGADRLYGQNGKDDSSVAAAMTPHSATRTTISSFGLREATPSSATTVTTR